MSRGIFKVPSKRPQHGSLSDFDQQKCITGKRTRTKEDFLEFCDMVLQYTQYESTRQEDARVSNNMSPLGSAGSSIAESLASEELALSMEADDGLASPESIDEHEVDEDEENRVTCFCGKPFAGRPMIECSECATWVHLSCVKIKKNNIPDTFICNDCKVLKYGTRKSHRSRFGKPVLDSL